MEIEAEGSNCSCGIVSYLVLWTSVLSVLPWRVYYHVDFYFLIYGYDAIILRIRTESVSLLCCSSLFFSSESRWKEREDCYLPCFEMSIRVRLSFDIRSSFRLYSSIFFNFFHVGFIAGAKYVPVVEIIAL
jgi:hypothetical protein